MISVVPAKGVVSATAIAVIPAKASAVIPAKVSAVIPAKVSAVIPAKERAVIPAKAGIQVASDPIIRRDVWRNHAVVLSNWAPACARATTIFVIPAEAGIQWRTPDDTGEDSRCALR